MSDHSPARPPPPPEGAPDNLAKPPARAPGPKSLPASTAKAQTPPAPDLTAVRPPAGPARMKGRHHGLILSFVCFVLLPIALSATWLWGFARDQYGAEAGFILRQEEAPSAGALAGGLASMLGLSSGGSNTRVLYEYIRSPGLVARLEAGVGLRAAYSPGWPQDFLYATPPDAPIEQLTRFWLRITDIAFDEASGLMQLRIRAPDPDLAVRLARLVVEEAQGMINGLNATARADAMRYAQSDLTSAITRLRSARSALSSFRAATNILDPAADLSGRMGVLSSLQQQLAEAMVEQGLSEAAQRDASDPRLRQSSHRIEVIRRQIDAERRRLGGHPSGPDPATPYPELLARYEELTVDLQVAEQIYRTAQAAHDLARARAERQTLYLASYLQPHRAERSEYPRRWQMLGLTALFSLLCWIVLTLILYSLRDRS